MTTHGQFNSKSPTIKRILKEAKELSASPSPVYYAAPLETNLFEWHFTLRGPPSPSDFAGGIYHGRIVLPNTYPLRPPSFKFLTPSGRFEVNREICLSISGHHEETWQPAWGIRTALVAIRSFMDSDAKGQLGGLTTGSAVRHKLAEESRWWKCSTCGSKSNEEIMKETESAGEGADAIENNQDETIPPELTLGYKDEMENRKQEEDSKARATAAEPIPAQKATENTGNGSNASNPSTHPPQNPTSPTSTVTATTQSRTAATLSVSQQQTRSNLGWIDICIVAVAVLLFAMILRKIM